MGELKSRAVSGLSWSFFSQIFRQTTSFAITAVLARLLAPGDFGLVGMATVFTGFAAIFNDMGIGSALIQKQNADDRHLSSAFWLNVFVGFVIAAIFAGVAPLVAAFYGRPELKPLLWVLSFNFILSSFTIIQQAQFAKRLDFRSLMIRDAASTVVSGGVGIVLALRGFGAWSLVCQTLSFTLLNGVMLWILSPWRPRFIFSGPALKEIAGFSSHMTGFNVVNYFARNVDYLLVGKFLGARDLGLYTLAYKLMLVPLQNVTYTIAKVAFPAFSKIQHDVARVRGGYLKIIQGIALITFPMMAGLAAAAPEFILTVYGESWAPVIPMIRMLCVVGALQSISSVSGSVYQSQGRPDIQLKLSLFLGLPTVALAVILGIRYDGINGVVLFYTLRTLLVTYISQSIVNRLIGLGWGQFFGCQLRAVLFAGLTGLAAWAAGLGCEAVHMGSLGSLLVKTAAGVMVFAAAAYPAYRGEIQEFLQKRKKGEPVSA